jgi:hypothetical protein
MVESWEELLYCRRTGPGLVRQVVLRVLTEVHRELGATNQLKCFHKVNFDVLVVGVGEWRCVLRRRCAYNRQYSAIDIQHAYIEETVRRTGIMTAFCDAVLEWCGVPGNHPIHAIYMLVGMVEDADGFEKFWTTYGDESNQIRTMYIVGYRLPVAVPICSPI